MIPTWRRLLFLPATWKVLEHGLPYGTYRTTVALLLSLPEMPVTVRVYVPDGVPVGGGGVVE